MNTKFRLPADMTPAPKALAVLEAWQAKHVAPRPEQAKRLLCSLFGFWRVCAHKRCRRALMCSGDPYACFQQFWPHVPEEAKDQYRAMIRPAPTDCADPPSRA